MLLIGHIRKSMPVFGKEKAQRKILDSLPSIFQQVRPGYACPIPPRAGTRPACGRSRALRRPRPLCPPNPSLAPLRASMGPPPVLPPSSSATIASLPATSRMSTASASCWRPLTSGGGRRAGIREMHGLPRPRQPATLAPRHVPLAPQPVGAGSPAAAAPRLAKVRALKALASALSHGGRQRARSRGACASLSGRGPFQPLSPRKADTLAAPSAPLIRPSLLPKLTEAKMADVSVVLHEYIPNLIKAFSNPYA
jgi:hypothetical protein